MSSDSDFTAHDLRDLFDKQKIVGVYKDWRAPNVEHLKELAEQIALLRHTYRLNRLIDHEAQETVECALKDMIPALPAIIQTNAAMAEEARRRGDSSESALRQQQRLQHLLEAAQAVWEDGIGWRVFPQTEKWHTYVVPLTEYFRDAMQVANPGIKLELSNHGPVSNFLAAVIPLISGESPKDETIARYLQREKENRPKRH
jgi:hypothetical protein